MAEGFSFDPANKSASDVIRPVKTTPKNIDVSLDDIITQKRKEQIEERKNQKQEAGDRRRIPQRRMSTISRTVRNVRTGRNMRSIQLQRRNSTPSDRRRPRDDSPEGQEPSRKVKQQKEKPRQIDVPEESLRKFLRGEGIKMDKNFIYKIMSYPKE